MISGSRAMILCCLLLLLCIEARPLNGPLLSTYDYIVVGGGASGLTVANRLSEDLDVTVLVLEAGQADQGEEINVVPVFEGHNVGGQYDWNLWTAPQTFLDGAARPMPMGRALGGGTILNALLWNRGGTGDYDDWAQLGNPGWSWDDMLPYFKKSETYTPEDRPHLAAQYSINYEPSLHGFSGPVNVAYPNYYYNQSVNFFEGLNILGVPTAFDPNSGTVAGAYALPLDINPVNMTRSDARRSYYDPYAYRDNWYVATGQHVTRLLFDETTLGGGAVLVTGVEFATSSTEARQTVSAKQEVILAAGALHTPQLLQLSGIGSSQLVESFNIPVVVNLPGVGQNLQDHYLVGTYYPFNNDSYIYPTDLNNATLNDLARQEYYATRTGPWTTNNLNGVAFPSLPDITNLSVSVAEAARAQAPDDYLLEGLDPSIVAGFAAQKPLLIQALLDRNRAAYEIIYNNAGNFPVAVMRPFSRGITHIRSSNAFDSPLIDPRYGSNPVDLQVLLAAIKFNREILATPPMMELQAAQFVPPIDANDDAIMQVIKNGVRTEYHPSGTCAMLPLELGGVVDSRLRVYGTHNLRIVDASVYPLLPAAHLQAVVYGVAEKAADIIKSDKVTGASTTPAPPSTALPLTSVSLASVGAQASETLPSSNVSSSTLVAFSSESKTFMSAPVSTTSIPPMPSVTPPSLAGSFITVTYLDVTSTFRLCPDTQADRENCRYICTVSGPSEDYQCSIIDTSVQPSATPPRDLGETCHPTCALTSLGSTSSNGRTINTSVESTTATSGGSNTPSGLPYIYNPVTPPRYQNLPTFTMASLILSTILLSSFATASGIQVRGALAATPSITGSPTAAPALAAAEITRAPSRSSRSNRRPDPSTRRPSRCPQSICVDAVNTCGVKYGGCYDQCRGAFTDLFTPPPCPTCPRTICADYVNECGIWYGGCFDECSGWPTFTPPPCPTTTTSTTSTTSTSIPCGTRTICADYVNECGIWYGGCYDECSGTPTFTPPPCTTTAVVTA